MSTLINIFLSLLFIALSGIHFYWLFGGQKCATAVIPTTSEGKATFMPGKLPTLIVATGLLLFAIIYSLSILPLPNHYPFIWWIKIIIPTIFLLRGIGEFNYVGIFKKIKTTPFAKNDSRIFTPLSFLISILGYCLFFNSLYV